MSFRLSERHRAARILYVLGKTTVWAERARWRLNRIKRQRADARADGFSSPSTISSQPCQPPCAAAA